MNILILVVVSIVTLLNIFISAYMTYTTLDIALHKCKCAVFNIYWILIFMYFLFSGVFLVYSYLVVFGTLNGYRFIYFIIGYIVCTFLFVLGSYYYVKYLESSSCDCVTEKYKKTLQVLTNIRFIMTIISMVALLSWGIYVLLGNSFVFKM